VEGIEVDLHWPEHKLIVEIDGYRTHDQRRAFETDRIRDQRLLVAGWRVARVTDWQMSELLAETAARFSLLLARSPRRAGGPR
jgi:very-short-patch-repair endonuclease